MLLGGAVGAGVEKTAKCSDTEGRPMHPPCTRHCTVTATIQYTRIIHNVLPVMKVIDLYDLDVKNYKMIDN